MQTKSHLNWKVQLAFGSALLILLFVGAVSYRSILASGESYQWVEHSHKVLENLQDLLLSVKSIESSTRGFVLTGNESYLESLQVQKLRAEADEAAVATMTADNPSQRWRIPALKMLAAQKIQFSELGVSLRRHQGLAASANRLRTGRGEQLMRGLQGVVGEMQDEERRLLVLREVNATRRLRQTRIVLLVGTFLSQVGPFSAITSDACWPSKRSAKARSVSAIWRITCPSLRGWPTRRAGSSGTTSAGLTTPAQLSRRWPIWAGKKCTTRTTGRG